MVFFGRFCRVRKRAPSRSGARMDSRPRLDVSTMAPKSTTAKDPDIHKVERLQVPYSTNAPAFGSDVVAETLSALDIPYIALNPGASRESVLRAYWIANTQPCGPTYINLDAEVQEAKLPAPLPPIDAKRYMPPMVQGPSADLVKKAVDMLLGAKKPLILAGRMSRKEDDWKRRVELAEAIDARVVTNLKIGAAFPTDHPLHLGYPATFATDDMINAVKDADVILSLDWVDLGGTFKAA